jgi:hypothetical protein
MEEPFKVWSLVVYKRGTDGSYKIYREENDFEKPID